MIGEYGVCAELSKRNHDVSPTLRNTQSADIYLHKDNGTYRAIEVKTSRDTKFVTGFFQKFYDLARVHPDYWVFVHLNKNDDAHYYILTHAEVEQVQMQQNNLTVRPTTKPKGCDNILLKQIVQHENAWHKIV